MILLLPGAIDYIYHAVEDGDAIGTKVPYESKTFWGGLSLLYWSLFLSLTYLSYHACFSLTYMFPNLVTVLVELVVTQMPQGLELFLEYIFDLRKYIARAIFFILLDVAYYLLLRPDINNLDEASWRPIVFKVISGLLALSVLRVAEKFLVQYIAARFHRTAYQDRIRDAKYAAKVLQHLSHQAKKILKERDQIQQALESRRARNHSVISTHIVNFIQPGRKKNHVRHVSADQAIPEHHAVSPSSHSEQLKHTTSFESLALHKTASLDNVAMDQAETRASSPDLPKYSRFWRFGRKDKQGENDASTIHSGSSLSDFSMDDHNVSTRFLRMAKDIGSGFEGHNPKEAKKISKRIFDALCYDTTLFLQRYSRKSAGAILDQRNQDRMDPDFLYLEDFAPYFPTTEQGMAAFELFDKDGNGTVSREEMRDTIVGLYKERKVLSSSLRDVGSAVGKLDLVLTVLTMVIGLLIVLLIFGIDLQSYLVTSVSLILAATFVFGNSARSMFEGIIFLFVTHPFDVGDRVLIDDQNLNVKELGILTTVFQRWDGQVIYMPNCILSTKDIMNVRRSPNQIDVVEITIAFDVINLYCAPTTHSVIDASRQAHCSSTQTYRILAC